MLNGYSSTCPFYELPSVEFTNALLQSVVTDLSNAFDFWTFKSALAASGYPEGAVVLLVNALQADM